MPRVTYIEHDGETKTVEAPAGRSLMSIATDHGVAGIVGECGGTCSCGTCHGFVDAAWRSLLPPISETEAFMLEGLPERRPESRLCCQIRLTPALDGIVVRLPKEQL